MNALQVSVLELGKALVVKDIALAFAQKKILELQQISDEKEDNIHGIQKTVQLDIQAGRISVSWADERGALEVIDQVKKIAESNSFARIESFGLQTTLLSNKPAQG